MSEISDIFAKAPPYSKDDLEKIIATERAARANFVLGGQKSRVKKPAGTKINLDELDV